jgi:hypothetical protein
MSKLFLIKLNRVLRFFFKEYHIVKTIYGNRWHKLIDIRANSEFHNLSNIVINSKKTLLYYDRLYSIYNALLDFKRRFRVDQKINFLEVGVYKGGGSYFIASVIKNHFNDNVSLYSVDTFEGHSSTDLVKLDDGIHIPGLFSETSFQTVTSYLNCFDFVKVIKGRIQESVDFLPNDNYGFIYLDMDIYEPTIFSLNYFSNKLISGGIILLDDYNFETCPGINRAVLEFINFNSNFIHIPLQTGQCLLIKL